jgi:biopolymer transport protein ExbD
MKLLDKPPKKVALNITPLIDVLFILIIFFTVSSTFLEQPGIELTLPDAQTGQAHTAQKVIIYVDKDENIYLNDHRIPIDSLAARTVNLIKDQSEKSVILRADKTVEHGTVIHIMDILRKNKIYKIVISTEMPPRHN